MALDKKEFNQREKYNSSENYKSKMKRDKAFQTKVKFVIFICTLIIIIIILDLCQFKKKIIFKYFDSRSPEKFLSGT